MTSAAPLSTVMLTTNCRPTISGTDDGIWRRVALVPWDEVIPAEKQDRDFYRKLVKSEGPGILRWMVSGAQAFIARGLQAPPRIQAATDEYRAESDPVGAFIDEWCDLGEALEQPSGELHAAYLRYAEENGADRVAVNVFAERLKRREFRKGTGRKRYTWVGIQLSRAAIERLERSPGGWPPAGGRR